MNYVLILLQMSQKVCSIKELWVGLEIHVTIKLLSLSLNKLALSTLPLPLLHSTIISIVHITSLLSTPSILFSIPPMCSFFLCGTKCSLCLLVGRPRGKKELLVSSARCFLFRSKGSCGLTSWYIL